MAFRWAELAHIENEHELNELWWFENLNWFHFNWGKVDRKYMWTKAKLVESKWSIEWIKDDQIEMINDKMIINNRVEF